MADAGRILIMPKGTYDASVSYEMLDLVFHNDISWLAKKPVIGIEPSDANSDYWARMTGDATWRTELDNILNGTTAVGNALKLNGLTAEEFVKGKLSFFQEGETILSWALNPNGEYKKIVAGGSYPSDSPLRVEGFAELLWTGGRIKVKFTEYIGKQRVWSRSIFGDSWYNEWALDKDGGNADTVDGLHASDLVRKFQGWGREFFGSANINTWVSDGVYAYQGGDTNQPHGDWGTIQVLAPLKSDRVTQIGYDWNEAYQPYRARYSNDGGANWSEWDYLNSSVLANYLPLDGSVPMSGHLLVNNGYGLFDAGSGVVGLSAWAETTGRVNGRKLMMYGSAHDDASSVVLQKFVNGNMVGEHTVLHTGNSQKVVTSASAPSDTSALWVVPKS